MAVGYVLCWIVGISTGGPDLPPGADADVVGSEFSGSLAILVFAVLVHGVAAVLLVALGRTLVSEPERRAPLVLASIAAALSLVQLIGEIVLVTGSDALPADVIWEVVSRVDGAKMLVLAALVVNVHGGVFRGRIAVTLVSAVTALALLTSGVGYLASIPGLMAAATASLPLLLVWVLTATHSAANRPS